jgi:hypothetical protein
MIGVNRNIDLAPHINEAKISNVKAILFKNIYFLLLSKCNDVITGTKEKIR